MKLNPRLTPIALLVAGLTLSQGALAFDGWHLESATPIPGTGSSWDYLSIDEARGRLFIGHRKEGLKVFDLASGKVIKVVDHTVAGSSNGATLMPEFDLGISNNEDGSITPFKLSTLEARPSIKLSSELDTSHYDPLTKRLLVNVAGDKDGGTDLVVLQAPALNVVGTIRVPSIKPEHADSDGKGNYFLTARDQDKVFRIDLKNLKVTATWSTPGCGQTNGLAIDPATDRIFLGCRGRGEVKPSFAVMNSTNGAIIYTHEVGGGNDGVIYDADLKRIILSNSVNAVINIFEQQGPDSYRPVESLGTRASVRTIALHSKTKKLYSFAAEGSADHARKITTTVSPFYANTFFPNTFTVMTYSRK
ncbi:YncE family protein [Massilia cavernae]|uniref:YncE family protein n=1 Tax=Massilia cavernae TaxID=2320864 RepID=A0A418Y4I4_9BURK|nr:YncE family protein [Massilia cavernae]RJG20734.1 YncE family protein [Massilia cavernae]